MRSKVLGSAGTSSVDFARVHCPAPATQATARSARSAQGGTPAPSRRRLRPRGAALRLLVPAGGFSCSGTYCRWNPIVRGLSCLASFTQCYVCEIHPSCQLLWSSIFFFFLIEGSIPLYEYATVYCLGCVHFGLLVMKLMNIFCTCLSLHMYCQSSCFTYKMGGRGNHRNDNHDN